MTIPLSHLTNGFDVTQTQWNALVDAVNNLYNAAINIGGSVGSAVAATNIGGDEVSSSTDGSGSVTVTHGLGWTPQVVFIQMRGNPATSGPYGTYVSTITGSSFIVFFRKLTDGSAAASGQAVVFDWLAFKGI